MYESLAKRPDSGPGVGSLDEVVDSYLGEPLLESNKILGYWREYEAAAGENQYKRALAKLARFYLTPPPTSTCVERLFSQAGNFLTPNRNKLHPLYCDIEDCLLYDACNASHGQTGSFRKDSFRHLEFIF